MGYKPLAGPIPIAVKEHWIPDLWHCGTHAWLPGTGGMEPMRHLQKASPKGAWWGK